MRQRSVNEKAVSKLINFLTSLKKDLDLGHGAITARQLQLKHGVSNSTYSTCRKLNIVTDDMSWNLFCKPNRETALKILEFLRQRSDKQTDKPISDLWIAEIASIKELLTQVRDNAKKNNNRSEGFKISERVYIAGQIASGIFDLEILHSNSGKIGSGKMIKEDISLLNDYVIFATDDLLSKLNS